jgi:predicted phage terminase large subunit-like protein
MLAELARSLADEIEGMAAISPQPGPQTVFLQSPADIAIFGGAAGGGKSYGLLLAPLRHIYTPGFNAVVFRRTLADSKKPGSIVDTSKTLYPEHGAELNTQALEWRFPSGAKVVFGHLEHELTVLDWQGAQVPLLLFDELTHFSRAQFFYMLSRNRSTCGVRPYVRATTNPDADSWVAEFISWWIDQEMGMPIVERAGVLRWFVRVGDVIIWGDTKEELQELHPDSEPKSVTFIPAKLEDNAILTRADPGYKANLLALPFVERERLLGGNWRIRPSSGLYFRRSWCEIVDVVPIGTTFVRGWDLAATPKTDSNDPDLTAGCKIGRMPDGRFVVADHRRLRAGPHEVEKELRTTAEIDGVVCAISLPQDPGQAGKAQALALTRLLAGFNVRTAPVTGDKLTRFNPFSAQAEAGNVVVLRGLWNEAWFTQLEGFPEVTHDDDVDATSQAFNALTGPGDGTAIIEFYRREVEADRTRLPAHLGGEKIISLIRLRAPEGISAVYGRSGNQYQIGADREVSAFEEDVEPLQSAGFVRIEGNANG